MGKKEENPPVGISMRWEENFANPQSYPIYYPHKHHKVLYPVQRAEKQMNGVTRSVHLTHSHTHILAFALAASPVVSEAHPHNCARCTLYHRRPQTQLLLRRAAFSRPELRGLGAMERAPPVRPTARMYGNR